MTKPVTWMQECAKFWDRYTYLNEMGQERYYEEAQMWLEKLRTAPPQSEWVGLTDKEIEDCLEMSIQGTCRAIEAKLREKNAND